MPMKLTTKTITKIAIFSAMSIILYVVPVFQIRLANVFPSFLEFHFDEIPIMIAGLAYGPMTAFWITLVKTIVKLPQSSTMMVGELADFLYTIALVIPTAIYYKKHKNIKGLAIAFSLGFASQIVVSSLCNSLFMIDFYLTLFGMKKETLLAGLHATNPLITDLKLTLTLFGIIPFNIVKNIIVLGLSFLIYRRIREFAERN